MSGGSATTTSAVVLRRRSESRLLTIDFVSAERRPAGSETYWLRSVTWTLGISSGETGRAAMAVQQTNAAIIIINILFFISICVYSYQTAGRLCPFNFR